MEKINFITDFSFIPFTTFITITFAILYFLYITPLSAILNAFNSEINNTSKKSFTIIALVLYIVSGVAFYILIILLDKLFEFYYPLIETRDTII